MKIGAMEHEVLLNGPLSDLLRSIIISIMKAITYCPHYKKFSPEEICLSVQSVRKKLLEIYQGVFSLSGKRSSGVREDWNEKMIEAKDLTTYIIYNSPYHGKYDFEMLKLEQKILELNQIK
ncbi:MAG: hypothetical protein HeimC2_42780 [Candidatus Heimdallarchaeota archaeon LC_2]|nr:MAG: hypothetical protein HeimC2_42780 [Candidatus Heimdallarchaeota archaeon LC_2]